jgi:hypothetical protein
MATVIPTAAAIFGINVAPVTSQTRTISTKMDRKDALNNVGDFIGIAFHGKMAEHSIELLSDDLSAYTIGATATVPTGFVAAVGGTIFCVDELMVEYNHDNFARASIKVSEYFVEN